MARRKIHALEVVVVGFDLRPHAHRVAQRRKDRDNFVHRARDGMLGAGEPPRAGQRNVDGLGLQRCIGSARRPRPSSNASTKFLENLEALPTAFFAWAGRGLQPAARNFVEQALLAPQPFEPERFAVSRQCGGSFARLRSSAANALSSAASSNAVRLGIASFVMRKDQDKALHAAAARAGSRPIKPLGILRIPCGKPCTLP